VTLLGTIKSSCEREGNVDITVEFYNHADALGSRYVRKLLQPGAEAGFAIVLDLDSELLTTGRVTSVSFSPIP
jgi:hypothetical protein